MKDYDSSSYDSLSKTPSTKWSINFIIAISLTTAFLFGYSLTSINPVKSLISAQFQWCPAADATNLKDSITKCQAGLQNGSAITVGVLAGAVLGSIIGGKLVSYGRRTAIILSHSIYFLGNIVSALAEGVLSLTTGRIILGIAIGICSYATPLYISEMTPKHIRGLYGVLFQLLITIGIFIANLLGLALGDIPKTFEELAANPITNFQKFWWRFTLGIPALLSILSILVYFYFLTFETPHFMVSNRKYEDAAALLRVMYKKEDVKEEYETILNAVNEAKVIQSVSIPIYKSLQSSLYRPVILIGFFLSSFQQFTGINLLITNSNTLFEGIGVGARTMLYLSVGLTFLNVVMTFPPIFIIDKIGRRTLLLISIIGMFIGVTPAFIASIASSGSEATLIIATVCTFIFIIFFAIGYGPIPYVFLHEIFPIEIKESAVSYCMALNWLGSIVIVAPSDALLQGGPLVMFAILFGTNLVALIFIFFFIKETKGISIDNSPYFKGKKLSLITAQLEKVKSGLFEKGPQSPSNEKLLTNETQNNLLSKQDSQISNEQPTISEYQTTILQEETKN